MNVTRDETVKFNKLHTLEVKGIAVLFMLFHHLFAYTEEKCERFGVSPYLLELDTVMDLAVAAKVCVAMFVFLSAFGITRSYNAHGSAMDRRQVGKFAWKRYVKMMTNYMFIYICAFLFQLIWSGKFASIYRGEGNLKAVLYAFIDLFGLAAFMGTPTLNITWWYMSIAVLMVFFLPCLIRWQKTAGSLVLIICAFAPYFNIADTSFGRYIFVMASGIFCAEYGLIEKTADKLLFKNKNADTAFKLAAAAGAFLLLYALRIRAGYEFWIDAFIAIDVCIMVYLISFGRKRIFPMKIMEFLGKYSMTIFLTHSFIFYYYFTEFVYSFQKCVPIFFALLFSSLLLAIGLEQMKKLFKIDHITKYLIEKIESV